jgi:hypothetical protein
MCVWLSGGVGVGVGLVAEAGVWGLRTSSRHAWQQQVQCVA